MGSRDPRICFVGDYLPDAEFAKVGPWASDAIVANLETVILEQGAALRPKAYSVHLGEDAYGRIERSGVFAFNLANNHVYDAGEPAFLQMLDRLGRLSGPQFYGLRDRPHAVVECGGLSCAVIGCLEPCRARGPALFPQEEVEPLIRRLAREHDRVFVTPHWGKEGELAFHPSPDQRALARRWIQAGADGIFGHHPHTIHGHESIEGRPVYYSLGNYQFDHAEGRRYPAAAWGMAVRVDPTRRGDACESHFFVQQDGQVIPADPDADAVLREHDLRLSRDLEGPSGDRWSWARTVGPVYISKCRNSWRMRLQTAPLRTAALWAAWNLLPRTVLFRLGCLLPDRDCAAYRASIDPRLLEAQKRLTARGR